MVLFYKGKCVIMVSIIITTKNEADRLPYLLKSLKDQTFRDFEVILVDNNSSDKTRALAKRSGCRVFVKGPERSTQRNFGVFKSRGEYVLILDADMILTNRILESCNEVVKSKPYFGALIIPEKSFGVGFWSKCKEFEREFYVGDETIEAPRFFKKSVFKEFNGYDERITGPEDYDLPLRMRKKGVKIGRINEFILHNEGGFSPIRSARKKFYYASHASVFLKRHPEQVFTTGNLIFRPVFFRKWRKLFSRPELALGMFIIKTLEGFGALAGIIYSGIISLA